MSRLHSIPEAERPSRCYQCGLLAPSIIHTNDGVSPDAHAFMPYPTFPHQDEAMRLLTTDRPRVVPAPRAAMHIDGGNGLTLCGETIEEFHGRAPEGVGRISCIRCGRLADGEAKAAALATCASDPIHCVSAEAGQCATHASTGDYGSREIPPPANVSAIVATSRRSMALGGDSILIPVRLVWLEQFPAEPVEIRAYDDGVSIWVDEVERDHMGFTVREAMPVEGQAVSDALDALAPNSRGRYDVTEILGGRDVAIGIDAAVRKAARS